MKRLGKTLMAVTLTAAWWPAHADEAVCTFQTQTPWAGATQTLFQIQNTSAQPLTDWGITIEYPNHHDVRKIASRLIDPQSSFQGIRQRGRGHPALR